MPVKCDWKQLPEQKSGWPLYRCQRCGWVLEIRLPDPESHFATAPDCGIVVARQRAQAEAIRQDRVKAGCGGSSSDGVIVLPLRFAKAVARWIAAGRPTRTQAQVDRIYEICRGCDTFDKKHQTCKGCGCYIRKNLPAFLNKLKMSTETCAKRPPKWSEPPEFFLSQTQSCPSKTPVGKVLGPSDSTRPPSAPPPRAIEPGHTFPVAESISGGDGLER